MFIKQLENFYTKIALYPPVVLFGHIQNPSSQEKKAEQRIVNICEDLYRIDNQTLSIFRSVANEANMCALFQKNLKDEYLIKSCAKFVVYLKHVHKQLEAMHKRDPILVKYFSEFKLNKQDFDLVWKYVVDNLKYTDIQTASKTFKEICLETENELKGNR